MEQGIGAPTLNFGPKSIAEELLVAGSSPFSTVVTRFALRKQIGISSNQQPATSN